MISLIQKAIELHKNSNYDAAREVYESILTSNPKHFDATHYLGVLHMHMGNYEKSAELILRALAINPQSAEANYNLGTTYMQMERFEQSITHFNNAVAIQPNFPQAYHNRGNAQRNIHQVAKSIKSYDLVLQFNPMHTEVRLNKAIALLMLGKYEEAWPLYETRLNAAESRGRIQNFTKPKLTLSDDLTGKIIYLYAEQGFGDSIQFSRYIPLLKRRGAKLVISAPDSLMTLFQYSFGSDAVFISMNQKPINFDYHCALPSLPHVFNTSMQTIPYSSGYLIANQDRVGYWNKLLGFKKKLRVGLAWSGNPNHRNDKHRSISIEKLLSHLPDQYEYISIQKNITDGESLLLSKKGVLNFESMLNDFSDTAALIKECDVVITVDSSPAHLSASLGVTTYLLLPYCSDWRWLISINNSPWYDALKIYRQAKKSNWDSVLNQVFVDLTSFKN